MNRRLARASFGPEWGPPGQMAEWLLGHHKRDKSKMAKYLRDARRSLAREEARWEDR